MTDTRRRVLHAGAAGAIGLLAAPFVAPRPAQAEPAKLPRAVTWPDEIALIDGRRLRGAALAARPAVVVFWESTCPFCRNHNRHVEKLHRAAAGTDLLVLGVSIDRNPEAAREYVRSNGYGFAVTRDAQALASMLGTRRGIPYTYAVARGAQLVAALPGEMFEEDVMEFLRLAQPLAGKP